MRHPHYFRRFYALLSVLILPGAARAQSIPSPYRFIETKQEFGLFAGHAHQARGRFGFGPGDGMLVGGRWGALLKGPISFEASTSLMSGKRDVIDPTRAEGSRKVGVADVSIGTIEAGLCFSLVGPRTWNRVNPFVDLGVGYAFDMGSLAQADMNLEEPNRFKFGGSFIATAGGGTRIFMSSRWSLRADATLSLWKLKTPIGYSDPNLGLRDVTQGEWVSGLRLTFSALFNR